MVVAVSVASPPPAVSANPASAHPVHRVDLPPGPWPTLLSFLCERFPAAGSAIWQQRIAEGRVWLANRHPINPGSAYTPNTTLFYQREPTPEPPVPFEPRIVFENDYLVVADKPHFLPVAPVGPFVHNTLQARLRLRLNQPALQAAHRLDRETAGLVLMVKHPEHRGMYQDLFAQHSIRKCYLATSNAHPETVQFPLQYQSRLAQTGPFFLQSEVPGAPNASTLIECLGLLPNGRTLFRLSPHTGRKHQLRVHLNACGCPIVGDRFYPQPAPHDLADFASPLQLLAADLAFTDPLTGQAFHFASTFSLDGVNLPHSSLLS